MHPYPRLVVPPAILGDGEDRRILHGQYPSYILIVGIFRFAGVFASLTVPSYHGRDLIFSVGKGHSERAGKAPHCARSAGTETRTSQVV